MILFFRMNRKLSILIIIILSLIDETALSLCFFLIPSENKSIFNASGLFSYQKSPFDLVMLSCVRFLIAFGCSIALCIRNGFANKMRKSANLFVYYGCGQAMYLTFKILFFKGSSGHVDTHFWVLIGSSAFTCITPYIFYKILMKGCFGEYRGFRNESIQSDNTTFNVQNVQNNGNLLITLSNWYCIKKSASFHYSVHFGH